MSKRFWGGLMLIALLIFMGSAGYLLMALREKATVNVMLQEISEPAPAPLPATETKPPALAATVQAPLQPAVKEASQQTGAKEETPHKESKKSGVTRNVKFTLHSKSARKVAVIGDFNGWVRKSLTKGKNNAWSVTAKITPGAYEYQFVVDGKKIADPNKKNSSNGKSILTVKPLEEK